MFNVAPFCYSADIPPVQKFIPDMPEHVRIYSSKHITDLMIKLVKSCREWKDVHAILNTTPQRKIQWRLIRRSWWPSHTLSLNLEDKC
jgi:hypothetical protein